MEITEEEYQQYEDLKRWAKREGVLKSAKETENLEDDIDEPVKICVAMFALLGCNPVYSCCGFDYSGQPYHKSHQYGRPYFILSSNASSTNIIFELSKLKSNWVASPNTRSYVNLELMAGKNPHWRKEECIHFSEECVIAIGQMELFLRRFEGRMIESIVLIDTNSISKKHHKYWQYPPKSPWHIQKKDVI
jgi:hypothetical protein